MIVAIVPEASQVLINSPIIIKIIIGIIPGLIPSAIPSITCSQVKPRNLP